MASITAQRDLVITLKKETLLNVGILSKLQPMPNELSRQVFDENALEKPTQHVFNHLAYYFATVIDPNASAELPWPIYDSKAERTYRNELALFISNHSAKGLLTPVMSSYFVNPGCYKVTFLVFQLSQLAVHMALVRRMDKEHQKELYTDMTDKYKSKKDEGFIERIEKETENMLSKFSNYLTTREMQEKIAAIYRKSIIQVEETLGRSNPQEYINIVDDYIKDNDVDDEMKSQLLKVKNVNEKSQVFDEYLTHLDDRLDVMAAEWDSKLSSFLSITQKTVRNSEALIARQTGEADKKTFTLEYNHKTDEIHTEELQSLVNSQQKYILKNIVRDERLNFPNLVRGYLISVCFILQNTETDASLEVFNKYLEGGQSKYAEVVEAMQILVERLMNAESRSTPQSEESNLTVTPQELTLIPPLPDLSDLKFNKQTYPQMTYDIFTPLNIAKHQFNLQRKLSNNNSFTKPLPKISLITPFHLKTNHEDFLRSNRSAYDHHNMSMNIHNMSTISHVSKANETVAECPGFTQQQIFRLLSTRKSTSSKKFKHKYSRPNIHVIKGGLFNESVSSNETLGLYRSHSSPNLLDIRDRRLLARNRAKNLSTMKEGSPSHLEVSGIAMLERDSNHSTPQGQDHVSVEVVTKIHMQSQSIPVIEDTPKNETLHSSLSTSGLHTNGKELVEDIQNVTLDKNTVLTRQNKTKNKKLTQWNSVGSIHTEQNNIKEYKSSENIQREHKSVLNIPTLRKSQIPRLATDKIHITHRSSENLHKLYSSREGVVMKRRSTEDLQKKRNSTENIQKGYGSNEMIKMEEKSPESIQKERKSTENIQTNRNSTENIQNACNIESIQTKTKNTETERKSIETTKEEIKIETPQPKQNIIKKTSSIEKIINRFKKVRARQVSNNILPEINTFNTEDSYEFNTIVEEKENMNTNMNMYNADFFTANRILLPDLLSPSCSILPKKSENFMDLFSSDEESPAKPRRPRESLGATLGVDHTFLDQFDLVD